MVSQQPKPHGTLEVSLVGAKGLEKTDWLSEIDPYCILSCSCQQHKTRVLKDKGSDPEWNDLYIFNINNLDVNEYLKIEVMDKDPLWSDFLGEAIIRLGDVFVKRNIPPRKYKLTKNNRESGEIEVGLVFMPNPSLKIK